MTGWTTYEALPHDRERAHLNGLPWFVAATLIRASPEKILTARQLQRMTDSDLLDLPNVGPKAFMFVRERFPHDPDAALDDWEEHALMVGRLG